MANECNRGPLGRGKRTDPRKGKQARTRGQTHTQARSQGAALEQEQGTQGQAASEGGVVIVWVLVLGMQIMPISFPSKEACERERAAMSSMGDCKAKTIPKMV